MTARPRAESSGMQCQAVGPTGCASAEAGRSNSGRRGGHPTAERDRRAGLLAGHGYRAKRCAGRPHADEMSAPALAPAPLGGRQRSLKQLMTRLGPIEKLAGAALATMPTRLSDPGIEDFLEPDGEGDPDWAGHYPYLPVGHVADADLPFYGTAFNRWMAKIATGWARSAVTSVWRTCSCWHSGPSSRWRAVP